MAPRPSPSTRRRDGRAPPPLASGPANGLVSVPQLKKNGKYHWPTVANAALAHMIRGLFPSLKLENLTAVNAREQAFATQFQAEVKEQDYERSMAHGQAGGGPARSRGGGAWAWWHHGLDRQQPITTALPRRQPLHLAPNAAHTG
jgi:hypothetical protein